MTDAAIDAGYCRRCGYPLRGLIEHRCPECGTVFDPADATSYANTLPPHPACRWLWCLNLVLCATFMIVLPVLMLQLVLFLAALVCGGWSALPYLFMAYLAHRSRRSLPIAVACTIGITGAGLLHMLVLWTAVAEPVAADGIALAVLPVYMLVGVAIVAAAATVYERWWAGDRRGRDG